MSSPQTNLGDLPSELLALIAERADTRSRCSLRKCSKSFLEIVKNSIHVCKQIKVELISSKMISIRINDNRKCFYAAKRGGCEIRKQRPSGGFEDDKTFLEGDNHLQVAVNDLLKILKNPRVMVKNLEIFQMTNRLSAFDPFITALSQELNQLDQKLHVEYTRLYCLSEDNMMRMLQCYEPGTLKVLNINPNRKQRNRLMFNRFVNLEQWKQARELHSTIAPMLSEVLHFRRVDIEENSDERSIQDVPWPEFKDFIEKVIAQPNPMEFKGHWFQIPRELNAFIKKFEDFEGDGAILKRLEDGKLLVLEIMDDYIEITKTRG